MGPLRLGRLRRRVRGAVKRRLVKVRGAVARKVSREAVRPFALARVRRGLHVEAVRRLGGSAFYLDGWAGGTDQRASFVVAADAGRARLVDPFRSPRPRLDRLLTLLGGRATPGDTGLIAFFELDPHVELDGRSRLEAHAQGEPVVAARLPAPELDPAENRAAIIGDLVRLRARRSELAPHAYPALERLQRSVVAESGIENLAQLGERRGSSRVSVVVALDRGWGSVQHQLAQFAQDRDFEEADLLYVCDRRTLDDGLLEAAEDLHSLYRVPFRLVGVTAGASFQAMSNLGAQLASSELVVLLDPDVLPDRPGWLESMRDFWAATPRLGALGPKLLYEDGAVRSAGASLSPSGQLVHRLQGSHRTLPAACETRAVNSVTTACMMVAKQTFESDGGLRGVHMGRDYEGADLCARLARAGRECWTLPRVELYHLDEVSRRETPEETAAALGYDAWAHRRLWGAPRQETVRSEMAGADGRGGVKSGT